MLMSRRRSRSTRSSADHNTPPLSSSPEPLGRTQAQRNRPCNDQDGVGDPARPVNSSRPLRRRTRMPILLGLIALTVALFPAAAMGAKVPKNFVGISEGGTIE